MTYEELLATIKSRNYRESRTLDTPYIALNAVMELCKDWQAKGSYCLPIEDVIQAIERELK
jgi:hypothetical protein